MERTPRPRIINVQLTEAEYATLTDAAEFYDRSIAATVRRALAQWVEGTEGRMAGLVYERKETP